MNDDTGTAAGVSRASGIVPRGSRIDCDEPRARKS